MFTLKWRLIVMKITFLNLKIKPEDHNIFLVSPKAYSEFIALLDALSQPNKQLLKTMQTPAPWDN